MHLRPKEMSSIMCMLYLHHWWPRCAFIIAIVFLDMREIFATINKSFQLTKNGMKCSFIYVLRIQGNLNTNICIVIRVFIIAELHHSHLYKAAMAKLKEDNINVSFILMMTWLFGVQYSIVLFTTIVTKLDWVQCLWVLSILLMTRQYGVIWTFYLYHWWPSYKCKWGPVFLYEIYPWLKD